MKPEEELAYLRKRINELEAQSQQLYQQVYLLQQNLSTSNLNEKERAEFISHVAHELRTPLTSIKGYIDLVLEGETGPITDMQREFLSVVGLNAEKLSNIIKDLLDVSRLEAGQLGIKPILSDFRSLVLETADELRPQLEAKGVRLETQTNGSSPLTATVDTDRMRQALRALIAHAGQVTPIEGTVKVIVNPSEAGNYAVVRVEDQGPGIDPSEIDLVFNKFWRPSNQTWREGGGPGLGLAIAKNIVDIHEGQIKAENQPDGGSVISFNIPLTTLPDYEFDHLAADDRDSQPHYAALVISHDLDFCNVVQQTLSEGGFQVLVSHNQAELVSDTPSWQPDLIVSNGAEPDLLNEADRQNFGPALKRAAILTLNLSPTEQRVISAGALAVLPWPANEAFILDHLEQTFMPEAQASDLEGFKLLHTILLVSPSSEALRSLDRLLRDAGYSKIYRAMREADALTLARRYRPNWLLLDIPSDTGREEGYTLFESLREDQLLRKTPTVVFLRPDQIAPDPSPDYRASTSYRKGGTTGELKRLRGTTGELRGRSGSGSLAGRLGTTGELRMRANAEANLRNNYTEELKGAFYNVVPKPFLQRRLISVARRLAGQK